MAVDDYALSWERQMENIEKLMEAIRDQMPTAAQAGKALQLMFQPPKPMPPVRPPRVRPAGDPRPGSRDWRYLDHVVSDAARLGAFGVSTNQQAPPVFPPREPGPMPTHLERDMLAVDREFRVVHWLMQPVGPILRRGIDRLYRWTMDPDVDRFEFFVGLTAWGAILLWLSYAAQRALGWR